MLVPVQSLGTYSGATGAVTTTAALATTYTGLVLTNPVNSPVNLVLEYASVAQIVAQTSTLSLGLLAGFSATTAVTQTTPVTPKGTFIGQPAGYGLLASSATLPAGPVYQMLLMSLDTGAITVQMNSEISPIPMRLQNGAPMIIVPPGGYVGFYTSAASVASSLAFGFVWSEI